MLANIVSRKIGSKSAFAMRTKLISKTGHIRAQPATVNKMGLNHYEELVMILISLHHRMLAIILSKNIGRKLGFRW